MAKRQWRLRYLHKWLNSTRQLIVKKRKKIDSDPSRTLKPKPSDTKRRISSNYEKSFPFQGNATKRVTKSTFHPIEQWPHALSLWHPLFYRNNHQTSLVATGARSWHRKRGDFTQCNFTYIGLSALSVGIWTSYCYYYLTILFSNKILINNKLKK